MKMPDGQVLLFNTDGLTVNVKAKELVLCKNCEFYTEEERWCRRLGLCGAFDQNGYCSHAERKEDG